MTVTHHGELTAPVIGTGIEEDSFRPDLNGYEITWSDLTGVPNENNPPAPNTINVYFRSTEEQLDALLADSTYFLHWYDVIPVEEEV